MKFISIQRSAMPFIAFAALVVIPAHRGRAGIGPTDTSDVYAIALDPNALTTIYAGTDDGIFKTTDGGQSWQLANDGIVGIIYSNMVVDPTNSNYVYMGTAGDGFFATSNGGQNWTHGEGSYHPVVKSISIDPVYSNVVNMGAFRDIYRSFDHGATFGILHQFDFATGVLSIANDPVSTTTIYIGTNTQGLLKSTDWGYNWFSTSLPPQLIGVVALDPGNHDVAFAAGANDLFKSTNDGQLWRAVLSLGTSYGTAIVFDTANPGTMYASFYYNGVYASNDGGETWYSANTGLPTVNINAMVVDSQNGIVYAGTDGSGIYVSYDGGQTWN
jgi:photosystem II stability/assembly factor-like uncharacterized protein